MGGQLTVLAGAPGSGKSTFVATLEDVSVLTTHQLRAHAQAPDPAFWVRMQREALRRLEAGEHVVIDACNTRRHSRLRWLRLGVPADLVVLQTRVELASTHNRIVPTLYRSPWSPSTAGSCIERYEPRSLGSRGGRCV